MKTSKTILAAVAFALAAAAPAFAQTAGVVVLDQHFNDIDQLPGWAQVNASVPPGQGWFQGNSGIFEAQSGPVDSYIAANYLSSLFGSGTIDNWLITPELSLAGPTQLSFYTRTQTIAGLNDMLEVRFSPGSATATSGFTTLLTTVGGASAYPGSWQQFTADMSVSGSGRFAFRYLGDAGASNYIGVDTILITTVPEPSAYFMFALGLAGLALLRKAGSMAMSPLSVGRCRVGMAGGHAHAERGACKDMFTPREYAHVRIRVGMSFRHPRRPHPPTRAQRRGARHTFFKAGK